LSKEAAKSIPGFPKATRIYMDGDTKKEAAAMYKERYEQAAVCRESDKPKPPASAMSNLYSEEDVDDIEQAIAAHLLVCGRPDGDKEALRAIFEVQALL
jgi:hypothetical protein